MQPYVNAGVTAATIRKSRAPRHIGIPDAPWQVGLGGTPPPGFKPRPKAPPAPLTDAQQAQAQVSAAFDPILKNINDTFARRSAEQQGAINGYTKTLADLMGSYAPESAKAYGGAVAGQSAIDASLAAGREGQGAAAQAELAQKLASINADPGTVSRISGGYATDLSGEAGAAAARGASSLASLLGEGAHAADYGAKLPAVGASMGLQATKQLQGQITNDLQTAVGDLAARRPDAYQSALSNISSTRQKQEQLDFENALAQKKYGLDFAKAKTSAAQTDTRLTIAQQNANTAAHRAATADDYASKNYGLRLRQIQDAEAKAAAARKSGGLTPAKVADLQRRAASELQSYYHGVAAQYQIGADGQRVLVTGTGPESVKTYQESIQALTLAYPALGPKRIIGMANKLYKPGEGGRPVFTAAEKKRANQINATLFPNLFDQTQNGGK